MKKYMLALAIILSTYLSYGQDTVQPKFKEGEHALMQFLQTNIQYPPFAKDEGIQGIVICSFIVTEQGGIENLHIVKSPGFDLDYETLRVIKLMDGKWDPATVGGKPFRKEIKFPVFYSLRNGRGGKEKAPSAKKLVEMKQAYEKAKEEGRVH